MNALVKQSATAVAQYGATDPFAAAAEDMGASSAAYLKFNGNTGEYTYGQQADELEHGTKLAVDMANMRRGWICWKDSEVVEEVMIRIIDGRPPLEKELTDHGPYIKDEDRNDGWAEQAAVSLRDVVTGESYTFKVTSKSALRALGTLLKDFQRQYKNFPGKLPIIELGASSFTPKNKTWGKKYAPVLKIVDWLDEEEIGSSFGDNPEDYQDQEDQAPEAEEEVREERAPAEKPRPAPQEAAKPAAAGPRRRTF